MLTIAFVFLSLHLLAVATPVDRGHKDENRIWLTKRSPPSIPVGIPIFTPVTSLLSLLFTQKKYVNTFEAYFRNVGQPHPLFEGFQPTNEPNVTRRATGQDPLSDESNGLFWKGDITVGTPPNTYTVDFDTGSSDLFLPGPSCGTTCSGHAIYNPGASSTARDRNEEYELRYGDGSSVQGEQFSDTVSISGLTATTQALGASTQYSSGFSRSRFSADGLLGMGYQSISQYDSPPPFQTMVSQGQTDIPVFAFKLAREGSELFLGGINDGLYTGDITYTPVTFQGYWQVIMNYVSANGNVAGSNLPAIIDTGTTLIIGDSNTVRALYSRIPGAKDASNVIAPGFYTFPCNTAPDVSMTFGGTPFSIRPELFNLGRISSGSNNCVGAVIGQRQRFWIIGDVFLQGVYTIFDLGNNQVGFATLK